VSRSFKTTVFPLRLLSFLKSKTMQSDDIKPADSYAGDISPQVAFQWMQSGQCALVDVRTDAEREWVGFVPGAYAVAWKQWPGMAPNANFEQEIRAVCDKAGVRRVALLCRSGVRSIAAAVFATDFGIEAFNILEGFEGDPDQSAHRGQKGGWRKAGLPWKQN
jgi:rhodanese-related sulfurtransferase